MDFKVMPFHPQVSDTGGAAQAAQELQTIINKQLDEGWVFRSLQSMATNVKPTGCAGVGQKEAVVNIQLIVFEKANP